MTTVNEELEVTEEIFQLYKASLTLNEIHYRLAACAKLSKKHGAEFDYITTKIAEIAKECEEYGAKFEKEGKAK